MSTSRPPIHIWNNEAHRAGIGGVCWSRRRRRGATTFILIQRRNVFTLSLTLHLFLLSALEACLCAFALNSTLFTTSPLPKEYISQVSELQHADWRCCMVAFTLRFCQQCHFCVILISREKSYIEKDTSVQEKPPSKPDTFSPKLCLTFSSFTGSTLKFSCSKILQQCKITSSHSVKYVAMFSVSHCF